MGPLFLAIGCVFLIAGALTTETKSGNVKKTSANSVPDDEPDKPENNSLHSNRRRIDGGDSGKFEGKADSVIQPTDEVTSNDST